MKRIAISGGPHTGKTTLFEALKSIYPDAAFIENPQTYILTTASTPTQRARIFSTGGLFYQLCLDYSEGRRARTAEAELALYDCTEVDTIAYAKRDNYTWLLPGGINLARAAGYSAVLFCDPISPLRTAMQLNDANEPLETHELLRTMYQEAGVPILNLPAAPLGERLQMTTRAIQALPGRDI